MSLVRIIKRNKVPILMMIIIVAGILAVTFLAKQYPALSIMIMNDALIIYFIYVKIDRSEKHIQGNCDNKINGSEKCLWNKIEEVEELVSSLKKNEK